MSKLYLPPEGRYYGCRHRHRLRYTSCQESRKYGGLFSRIAGEMGHDIATVKRLMRRMGRRMI